MALATAVPPLVSVPLTVLVLTLLLAVRLEAVAAMAVAYVAGWSAPRASIQIASRLRKLR